MTCTNVCQIKTAGVAGAFFVLIGAIFLGCWSKLFDFVLHKQLILTENSYSNELWENFPIPIYVDFYFFNWTNPEDFLNEDPEIAKPKFNEMGPYVFSEKRKKVILSRNDGYTVTFMQSRSWVFEPSLSVGSVEDLATTINIPAVALSFALRDYPKWVKTLVNELLHSYKTPLAINVTVNEVLFKGYQDPLLDLANMLPPGILPIAIPFDRLGLFYARNGSKEYEGVYEMFTGKGNISRFGKMARWNNENPTHYFDAECGLIMGSAGELFAPHPKKGESISIFSSDGCRTVELKFKEEVTVDGIEGYRYWSDEHVFDNVTAKNETWCYCPSDACAPHGAVDVSPCKWGMPVYLSLPHFLHADPSYHQAVDGMKPDENVHKIFVDLEKNSGIPIQGEGSFQLNLLVQPFEEYDLFAKIPRLYFPALWFKQRVKVDEKYGNMLRLVSRAPTAGYVLFGGLLCIGLGILGLTGTLYYINVKKRRSKETDA